MSTLEMAGAERRDLADFCSGLSETDWDAPSLCAGWRVRDVVAHVVSYEGLGLAGFAGRLVRARLDPHRANREAVAGLAESDPAQLLERLRGAQEPTGVLTAFGGRIVLADTLIHHQDLRRPLGVPRDVPGERLLVALPLAMLAPVVGGAWHVRGVRLIATDLDWAWGAGPEARGPGEAVLMAAAGRRGAADDLQGPGADLLQRRLG
jgi:uncharacterized protein (TIGR03083 family)